MFDVLLDKMPIDMAIDTIGKANKEGKTAPYILPNSYSFRRFFDGAIVLDYDILAVLPDEIIRGFLENGATILVVTPRRARKAVNLYLRGKGLEFPYRLIKIDHGSLKGFLDKKNIMPSNVICFAYIINFAKNNLFRTLPKESSVVMYSFFPESLENRSFLEKGGNYAVTKNLDALKKYFCEAIGAR
jgi:hypothetical protein